MFWISIRKFGAGHRIDPVDISEMQSISKFKHCVCFPFARVGRIDLLCFLSVLGFFKNLIILYNFLYTSKSLNQKIMYF